MAVLLAASVFNERLRIPNSSRRGQVKNRPIVKAPSTISRKEIWEKLELLAGKPDVDGYDLLLHKCGEARAFTIAKSVHAQICETGLEKSLRLKHSLIEVYGECGQIADARKVFDSISTRTALSWKIMFTAYAQNGHYNEVLLLFTEMDVEPCKSTFLVLLRACSQMGALRIGRLVHKELMDCGLDSDLRVAKALMNMYGKTGSVGEAKLVFDDVPVKSRDVVIWNTMISAYALNRRGVRAMEVYREMLRHKKRVQPAAATFVSVLEACKVMQAFEEGKKIHSEVIARKLDENDIVATALLTMYGKCGHLDEAEAVFNTLKLKTFVTWTAMLSLYSEFRQDQKALDLFGKMVAEQVKTTEIACKVCLEVCSRLKAFSIGMEVHSRFTANKLRMNDLYARALVKLHAECGELGRIPKLLARHNFPVMWNAVLVVFTQRGMYREALRVYGDMARKGLRPTAQTYTTILDACGSIGAIDEGRMIHGHLFHTGFERDVVVGAALMAMYSNCGDLWEAEMVFVEMARSSVIGWTTMIGAYGKHRRIAEALELFFMLFQRGMKPSRSTFISVLSSCSEVGCLEQAAYFFGFMKLDCEVVPVAHHYWFIIDLLARFGRLQDAEELINSMPYYPGCLAWFSLLEGCRAHRDVERGRRAAEQILELEPQNALVFFRLGQIYKQAEMLEELVELKKLMNQRGITREQIENVQGPQRPSIMRFQNSEEQEHQEPTWEEDETDSRLPMLRCPQGRIQLYT